jgi:hypothetical protein
LPLYRYRLIDRVGNDLGLFVSGFEDWRPFVPLVVQVEGGRLTL